MLLLLPLQLVLQFLSLAVHRSDTDLMRLSCLGMESPSTSASIPPYLEYIVVRFPGVFIRQHLQGV